MKAKKMLAYLLAFAMVFTSTVGTSSLQAEAKAKTKVKKVTIKNELYGKKLYVAKGKKATIKANVNVTPNKKANKKVTFKSKNAKIAKVDKKGKVTAKKVGTTKITVASKVNKKKKATVTVVVTNPVKSISLDKSKLELEEGKTATLKATVTPTKKVCKYVKWSTVDSKVATVDQNGNVKAVSEGKVTIKATAVDGSKKVATCEVVVKKATTQKKEDNKKPEENKKPQTPEKKPEAPKKLSIEKVEFFDPDETGYTDVIEVTLSEDKDMDESCFKVELVNIEDKDANIKAQSDDDDEYDDDDYEEYVRTFDVEKVKKVAAGKYRVQLSDYFMLGEIAFVSVKGVENPAQAQYLLPAKDMSSVIMRNVTSVPEDYDDEDIFDEGCEYVDFYVDFVNMIGDYEVKIVSGKLPKGLEFLQDEYDVYGELISQGVVGFPREAGVSTVVFEAKDSRGAVAKHTVTFMIGDENSVYAENVVEPYDIYENEPFNIYAMIVGGSGEYSVSVDKQYADMVQVEADGSDITFSFEDGMKAGKYVIPYTVKDKENNKLTANGTIEFTIIKVCNVDIDADGSQVALVDVNTERVYFYDYETGKLVVPVGKYDVCIMDVFHNLIVVDKNVVINDNFTKEYPSIGSFDFKCVNAPTEDCLYELYLENKEGEKSDSLSGYFADGEEKVFFDVAAGEYKLVAYLMDKWGTVVGKKEDVVTAKAGSVYNLEFDTTDVDSQRPTPVGEIKLKEEYSSYNVRTVQDGFVYYTFTPNASDDYVFSLEDDWDYNIWILDEDGNPVAEGWGDVAASLKKGTTYYVGVRHESFEGQKKTILYVYKDSEYED